MLFKKTLLFLSLSLIFNLLGASFSLENFDFKAFESLVISLLSLNEITEQAIEEQLGLLHSSSKKSIEEYFSITLGRDFNNTIFVQAAKKNILSTGNARFVDFFEQVLEIGKLPKDAVTQNLIEFSRHYAKNENSETFFLAIKEASSEQGLLDRLENLSKTNPAMSKIFIRLLDHTISISKLPSTQEKDLFIKNFVTDASERKKFLQHCGHAPKGTFSTTTIIASVSVVGILTMFAFKQFLQMRSKNKASAAKVI